MSSLQFEKNDYNPRTPSPARVNELLASVRQLSLLSPLTCAFMPLGEKELVLLIDGRHRYEALEALAKEDPDWARQARVDLKIYYGLSRSDLHVMATYLNRTRRALRKGEYYKAIVKIFEQKELELRQETGKPVKEIDIFNSIHARELTNRDLDLSVGRLVGIAAFDDEEADSWYPLVGTHQHEKCDIAGQTYYCPLTAGNLAEFLSYLCFGHPYPDLGERRAVELGNVIRLGRLFRSLVLNDPVKQRHDTTHTTVGSKFWCMAALGGLLENSEAIPEAPRGSSALANDDLDWKAIEEVIEGYAKVMKKQADIVRGYKDTSEPGFLKDAWSYQTQREQVRVPLKQELAKRGVRFRIGE